VERRLLAFNFLSERMFHTANQRNRPELNKQQEVRELVIFEGAELCCHRSGHFCEQVDTEV
jgi:hypothetical protein